jgi:hypothetical protein
MIAAYAHLGPFSGRVVAAIDHRLATLDNEMPATFPTARELTLRR